MQNSPYLDRRPRSVAEVFAERVMSRNELYHAWVAADDAWQAELVKAFGKAAGDRRYDRDQKDHPPACRAAYERWRAAGVAWEAGKDV